MTIATAVATRRPERERYDAILSLQRSCMVSFSVFTVTSPFADFPVQLGGFGTHHAAFLNESRTRGRGQCSVQEIRVRLLYLLSERRFCLVLPEEGTILGKHGRSRMTDFQIILSTCADHEQAK